MFLPLVFLLCFTSACQQAEEVANLLEEKIQNAKKIVIPEAGHIMNMEKPEEFNKAVLDFVRGFE
jgi:pimeloyl-ACP methyl ester carboxylesterase